MDQKTALSTGVVAVNDRVEVVLPSGAKAQILRVSKGKHLNLASRIAGPSAPPGSYQFGLALVSVRALVNGAAITVEDLDEMWADDVMVLWGECMGKGGSPEAPSTSPSSESTAASTTET